MQKENPVPPRLLRLLTSIIPLTVAIFILVMGLAALLEINAPKGTFLWLVQNGLDARVQVIYTLWCGVMGVLYYRRMRLDRIRGVAFAAWVTSSYLFYSLALIINNVLINHQGSIISVVSQTGGYLWLMFILLVSSLLSAWIDVGQAGRTDH